MEAEKIVQFEPKKREVPALGMSTTVTMTGDRQIVLQYFVPGDAPLADKNAAMDEMWVVLDRQKARYELVGLRADLAKQKKVLERMLEDIPRAEEDFKGKQDGLLEQIKKCNALSEEAVQTSYNNWASRGKRGSHKPEGSTKSLIEGMDRQIKAHEEKMAQNEAEKAKFLVNIEASAARFRQEIAEIEAEIARREALLG